MTVRALRTFGPYLLGEIAERAGEQPDFRSVTGVTSVGVECAREAGQRSATRCTGHLLCRSNVRADRREARGAQAIRALELVSVCAGNREAGWPRELRLALCVQVLELHGVRRVDLVLRQVLARN